ncbi:MAG: ABC transporter ATP-binding protein [Candidatus Aminicenantes bacterium]|nr:ABC transporter ATP-binding protein [Candidatus Aminicenantes bacterium]
MKCILSVDNLSKKFGRKTAISGVTFSVKEGEVFGILGPNGAGKSTTLSIITGLVRPDEGKVEIFGRKFPGEFIKAMENVGVLVENPGFYNHFSAVENMKLFCRLKKASFSEIKPILKNVGLLPQCRRKVGGFSQGMRKRLGLAAAILGHPRLLVLDEPTSNLDPRGTQDILQMVRTLSKKNKTTVVISSNLLHDIEAVSDRVLLIDRGEVLFCRSIPELLQAGENTYFINVDAPDKAFAYLNNLSGIKHLKKLGESSLSVVLSGMLPENLNKTLVAQGIGVKELRPVRRTLQELFLQLEGLHELRNHALPSE